MSAFANNPFVQRDKQKQRESLGGVDKKPEPPKPKKIIKDSPFGAKKGEETDKKAAPWGPTKS